MNYQVCTHWNVRDLLRMQGYGQLTPPAEFHRGPKWSSSQKKLYIDSLLRGYPSPAFYLHCSDPDAIIRHDSRMGFGVIDGQQRLTSLGEFGTNSWRLLKSPGAGTDASKHFPVEPTAPPGPEWAGLRYDDFTDELKRRFVSLTLPVIVVKTSDVAVVRDLFIRLQAGTALSAQERRDAWPGEFPEFIKRVAGHPHVAQGYRLFRDLVRGRDDAHRRLAAQPTCFGAIGPPPVGTSRTLHPLVSTISTALASASTLDLPRPNAFESSSAALATFSSRRRASGLSTLSYTACCSWKKSTVEANCL